MNRNSDEYYASLRENKNKNKKILATSLGLLGTTAAIGFGAFFYYRYRIAGPSEYIVRTGLGLKDLSVTKKAFQ